MGSMPRTKHTKRGPKLCSTCHAKRRRPGQRTCRGCHAAWMRNDRIRKAEARA